ncbi:MAG: formyl transferase, partial [Candidatus Margulisbacteria bacterium]|nr:formyl transferase [Candidatus Margulisiibacteriota bacterium]
FFEEFFRNYANNREVLGVVVCPTMGKKSLFRLFIQMYNFYGLKDFLRTLLRHLLVSLKGNTLKRICSRYDIPFFEESDINSNSFINYWKKRNLNLIISVSASQIFKKELLSLPLNGCINIHNAKLPYFRGMMPIFWQLYSFKKCVGITVHKINLKIDQGDIILQREIPIIEGGSLDSTIKRAKKIGAHCIIEAINLIKSGKVEFFPNIPEQGSYFSFPRREDVLEFRRRGNKIYD